MAGCRRGRAFPATSRRCGWAARGGWPEARPAWYVLGGAVTVFLAGLGTAAFMAGGSPQAPEPEPRVTPAVDVFMFQHELVTGEVPVAPGARGRVPPAAVRDRLAATRPEHGQPVGGDRPARGLRRPGRTRRPARSCPGQHPGHGRRPAAPAGSGPGPGRSRYPGVQRGPAADAGGGRRLPVRRLPRHPGHRPVGSGRPQHRGGPGLASARRRVCSAAASPTPTPGPARWPTRPRS